MRVILITLLVCLQSIIFVSCKNGEQKIMTQNETKEVANWENIGQTRYEHTSGMGSSCFVWVKNVGNQLFYAVSMEKEGDKYILLPNPKYGTTSYYTSAENKFRYKIYVPQNKLGYEIYFVDYK